MFWNKSKKGFSQMNVDAIGLYLSEASELKDFKQSWIVCKVLRFKVTLKFIINHVLLGLDAKE